MPQKARLIVVSTHFDDAALSAAHLLQRAGRAATMLTVCSGVPPPELEVSDWDDESGFLSGAEAALARAHEDWRACALTGASRVGLGHLDRPYRRGADVPAAVLLEQVARLLEPTAALWIPASIGGNPDHVAVTSALLPLARELPVGRVGVYADLPYAESSGYDLPARVAEALPGLRAADVPVRDADFQRKLAAVRCHASQLAALGRADPEMLRAGGVLAHERCWSR
jgi:LmbE family N-acetylglucosaminyl deacetylase